MPAQSFVGVRAGFVFQTGPLGTGYYRAAAASARSAPKPNASPSEALAADTTAGAPSLAVDTTTGAATIPAATPAAGCMKTAHSPNARAKCQLCRCKIVKGAWRTQLAVTDTPYSEALGHTGRVQWQSAHTACYLHNVLTGNASRSTTQSRPYWGGEPVSEWRRVPALDLPNTAAGESVAKTSVVLSERGGDMDGDMPLEECLPAPADRACLAAAVAAVFPGLEALGEREQQILEVICLRKYRLCKRTQRWLDELEAAEGAYTLFLSPTLFSALAPEFIISVAEDPFALLQARNWSNLTTVVIP